MVGPDRLELSTLGLKGPYSTIELWTHADIIYDLVYKSRANT